MTLEVKQLSLSKNGNQLLSDINFSAKSGEIIAIVGENGAGKSTLLHCLSGINASNENVILNGTPVESYSLPELAKVRAVLPQDNNLTFPFQVKEVVRLGLSLLTMSSLQQDEIIDKCLHLVDAYQYKDRSYINLSGGEKQRVQLARVLAQISIKAKAARYLLLDEPTSALDLKHQYATLKMLKDKCKDDIGIFVVVHDLNIAAFYCDKILLLKQGQLLAYGSPEDIMQQEVIKEAFGIDVYINTHPQYKKPYMVNQQL